MTDVNESAQVDRDTLSCDTLIVQINAYKLRDIGVYKEWAIENKADVLVVTEHGYSPDTARDENCFVKECQDSRVAVYKVSDRVKVSCPYIDTHHVVVKLQPAGIMLHAWYLPPRPTGGQLATDLGSKVAEVEEQLLNALSRHKSKTVHLGDFNSRAKQIGDTINDKRGPKLLEAMVTGGYEIANKPGVPTYHTITKGPGKRLNADGSTALGTSIIDWTVYSIDLAGRISWDIAPARFGTDHEFILVSVSNTSARRIAATTKTVISPGKFLSEVTRLTKNCGVENWHDLYMQAVKAAQVVRRSRTGPPLPDEVTFLGERIDALAKTISRAKGALDHLRPELGELSKQHRKARAKWASDQMLNRVRSSTKRASSMEDVDRMNKTARLCYLQHGDRQLRGAEAAEVILNKCYPDVRKENLSIEAVLRVLGADDPPITRCEIETALASFAAGKAPGKSGVNFDLLRQWYAKDSDFFFKLFTDWWEKRIFPPELKESVLVMLLKDKNKASSLDNVRPISLMECIGRWYEKIIDMRLMYHVEQRGLLSDFQYGYRVGRSAVDATYQVHKERQENAHLKEVVVQTDVRAAFDLLKHSAIVKTLVAMRLPANLVQVIVSYLTDRRVTTTLNDEEVAKDMVRGAPQGSSLGPHLYILSTSRMLDVVKAKMQEMADTKASVISYADDVILTLASGTHEEALRRANELVTVIDQQLDLVGLSLAKQKTKVMITAPLEDKREVEVAGEKVVATPTIKVLGVKFSHDRSYASHMNEMVEKCSSWLTANYKLLGYKSPLSFEQRKELVQTVLVPKLTWGAEVWNDKRSANKTYLKRVARMIARQVTSSPFTAGYTAVTTLSQMLPFDHLCKQIAGCAKVYRRGKIGRSEIDKLIEQHELGHPATWERMQFGGTLTTNAQIDAVVADIKFFTDGSQSEHNGATVTGAAYVAFQEGEEPLIYMVKLDGRNSVYQAEAQAIRAALEEIDERPNNTRAAIFSDSLSALRAITGITSRSKIVNDCRRWIKHLAAGGGTIELYHCKAHVGITGNELADAYAKQASISGERLVLPVPKSAVKNEQKAAAWADYEKAFHTDKYGRTIKSFFAGPTDQRLKQATVEGWTSLIYTGHGSNRESMKFGFRGSGQSCPCGADQTMEHVIHTCPLFMTENLRYAREAGISGDEYLVPWNQLVTNKKFHHFIRLRAKSLHSELEALNRGLLDANDLSTRMWKMHIDDTSGIRKLNARLKVHPRNNWFRVCEGEVAPNGNAPCLSRGQLTVSRHGEAWSITQGWHNNEQDNAEPSWLQERIEFDPAPEHSEGQVAGPSVTDAGALERDE